MSDFSIAKWTSRPVFISSTFRDMHAERDYLDRNVFPVLTERMLSRRCHFEPIDLRGADVGDPSAESNRELAVLRVCLDEIKNSRPFLIVFLGDRYGWVPPAHHLYAAAREAGYVQDLDGISVTALESVLSGSMRDATRP